jgi:hypothetical protein
VAGLAEHPEEIQPLRVHDVEHDLEIQAVLGAIVRRWKIPARYISTAALHGPRKDVVHLEHVVPIRVLANRMIKNRTECEELLKTAVVIALITPAEHRKLGGMFKVPGLYGRMLEAPVSELPDLGMERYRAEGIELHPMS